MSKVKKNIRLCAISTDFSELGGYRAQFVGEQDVKDARDFTAEVIDELGIVADGALLAPFAKATFTVRSRAGNPEGLPQEKEIQATVKFAGPVPIATNSDGTVKCMSVEDPESPELPVLGDDWTIGFEGLADNAKWRYDSTSFKVGGETKDSRATCDGDTLTFCGVEGVGETGEYDGVITVTLVDKEDEETTDTVDIPVRFHADEH